MIELLFLLLPVAAAYGYVMGKNNASNEAQQKLVGQQGADRVWLFLQTDDFYRDHKAMLARGVKFLESPREEPYGIVAVFEDDFGNKWDLIEKR